MPTHTEIGEFIWRIADHLRGDYEKNDNEDVKRYESKTAKAGDTWRHERITLKPLNPDFKPIILTGADEGQLQVIAELVEVLGQAS